MATATDAARDRVIEARAELADELETMEASVRAAVDIPAKIRRSPAKAAAIVGGLGFLALKGPQRVVGAAKRAVRGPAAAMPKSMLPDEIEKTLRSLGSDGDKVRGVLERDFAAYAKQSKRDQTRTRRFFLLTVGAPLLTRGSRAAVDWLLRPTDESFSHRLAQIRERTERQIEQAREGGTGGKAGSRNASGSEDDTADAGA